MPPVRTSRQRQRQRSRTPPEPERQSPSPSRAATPADEVHHLDAERSPLPTDSRQLTRLVAMSWTPRSLTNAATKLRRAMDDGSEQAIRDGASKTEKRYFDLYDKLDRLQPDLFDLLDARDSHFMRNVRQKLADGRNGAKAEDNHKAKHSLPHLRAWTPSLVDEPKGSRGLAHPECAYMLSPTTIDWDNEEQKRQFIECSNPPMTHKHWSRFLWADCKADPNHPSKGMLQNKLLVDMANVILKSPSSVIPTARVRPNVVRRGRKGIAAKYQLTKVTTGFLAYVAVMTRYALSSETTFDEDGGTFNYVKFYDDIRTYLEAPKFKRRAKVLIDWWNKTLFPDVVQGDDGTEGEDTADGTLALLEAEVEEDGDLETADD
ncbi:hypothetical protein RhiJN_19914 [Ceratobasidium sp. AG-Ba]|nr:hypothetical protein RhiJN_19914 [Ceratobasidium sp. AG-Ba]